MHFTIKNQTLDFIKEKLDNYLKNNSNIIDFSEEITILNHCFLPREIVVEKGFNTDLIDYLEKISYGCQVEWYDKNDLNKSRILMLENIKKNNGVSLFIGNISVGVKEEYELANLIGVETIII